MNGKFPGHYFQNQAWHKSFAVRGLHSFVLLFILSCILLILPVKSMASVWNHRADDKSQWNEDWENSYATWVQEKLTDQWLKEPSNPFYRWKVDCAKFVYLARLHFSFENGLEFAIHDPRGKGGAILTSKSSNWDHITDPAKRLKTFAQFILSSVNTGTLQKDSLLIAINKNSIKPGVILAADAKRAHTWLVKKIDPSGMALLLFGTLPASEFLYESYTFPASETAFPLGKVPRADYGGFRQFKWPQYLLHKDTEIPYYKSDQTSMSYKSFFEDVQKVIQLIPETNNERFRYLLEEICMKVRVRVNIIIDAAHRLAELKGNPMPEDDIDLYSTYKRDEDIETAFRRIDEKYIQHLSELNQENSLAYRSLRYPSWTNEDYCWIRWAQNRTEPLGTIRAKFYGKKISSDPQSSFSNRWGE